MKQQVKLLDCTLRDGSYVNNFQFTKEQTKSFVSNIEKCGLDIIEVGHGMGLGASRAGLGQARESDDDYLKATAEAVTTAKWGMFCIPGVATLEDVDKAASYGMSVIRIGTELVKCKDMLPYIDRAKKYNMYTCCNFLKTHLSSTDELVEHAQTVASAGADAVYVVDSTGCMLPKQVFEKVKSLHDILDDVTIGFHGHDNLGLSVANSISAIEAGGGIVDVTSQGLGRSAGNTPTERFACVLMRLGYDISIDLLKLMELGNTDIRSMLPYKGIDSLDTILGLTCSHSGGFKPEDKEKLLSDFLNA